jgi:uncharacterized protein
MTAWSKKRARTGVGLFLLLVSTSSVLIQISAPALKSVAGAHLITAYMWWVAGSSMIVRLLLREPLHDVSFRWNGWRTTRAMLVGISMPLFVGAISYGLAWATGLAHFAPASLPDKIFLVSLGGTDTARFWKYLLICWIVGGLWSCKSAAGEEIGWRGYMVTRLIKSGLPAPLFFSGLIWALWHLPLILSGLYGLVDITPGAIAIFAINIIGLGYIFAWLRLSSGSIWPCICAHGAWNATIVGAFGDCTRGGRVWVGEAGVLTAIVVILCAAGLNWIWPLPRPERYQEEAAPISPMQ